ncbi:winged helix DNA-binding protein [Streptomyces sp. NPDC001401]|uniref:LexA family protein n=1 Tax=Streptomyces sp. NPDC001401 TaxID=3364570 RepID=UPI0036B9A2EA
MTTDDLPVPDSSPTPPLEDSAVSPDVQLTERQLGILQCIRQAVQMRGYPPSLREICQAVGLRSTSSVAHQLRQLEKKGLVAVDPRRPRAYRLLTGDATGPQIPPVQQVGCLLLAGDSAEEHTSPLVLRVVLDPPTRRALLSGALPTVKQQPMSDTNCIAFSDAGILGQVTAVAHPVESPHCP